MMNHDPNLPAKSSESVRIVHIGDVVGKPGMTIVCSMIEMLREQLNTRALRQFRSGTAMLT